MSEPKLRKPKAPMRARNRWFLNNRVFLGMLVFFVAVGMWEFRWKPQYRPFYEQGIALYQKEQYLPALRQFTRAYEISPNAVDVIIMMGWTNLKLKRWEEARFYFNRAIRIDPRLEEAQMGAAFVALETGHGKLDPALLSRLLGKRQGDPNVMILAAGALQQEGEYLAAAEIYRRLESDKNYGTAAKLALSNIYGTDGFESDQVPATLPAPVRPAQLQVRFRAADGALWRASAGGWEKFYVNGVDLGPAAPGYYPLSLPTKGDLYLIWVRLASQMNANTLRAYTLLPPSFYRAFQHYRAEGGNMGLIQQIWVSEPPNRDLYTPKYVDETRAEIRSLVDALHGRGQVPPAPGRNGGIYDQDLSPAVVGILLGGELEQATIDQTDVLNIGKSSYQGKYVSIAQASPSEVWYAQMLDYLVEYETTTYNWQHPVAVSNGPQTDPKHGTLIEENLRAGAAFPAGLFAAYSAFPYYPESLTREPEYVRARDSQGPNPVAGYLRALRSRISVPLVVAEYGISTAIGVRRVQVNGWNQGGHSEQSQADVLARLDSTIRDAGCAGGIVFELADEWYRQGWMPEGYESPADRAPLWVNQLDPNKSYGLLGYRTRGWRLFAGDESAWEKETRLYGAARGSARDPYDADRQIQSVQAAADEAFLYLRINVACLDCVSGRHDGKTHFDQAPWAVAISTLPGHAGIQRLPFGGLSDNSGVDFLLLLGAPAQSRLLVAENYNPYVVAPRGDYPNEVQMSYRSGFSVALAPAGRFIEYPAGPGGSPSTLHYGDGNPAAKDYDSQAEWYADLKHNALLVRIAWGKLLITDPSSMRAFFGYGTDSGVRSAVSPGIELSVFALAGGGSDLTQAGVAASVPEISDGKVAKANPLTWPGWNAAGPPDPYRKKAYFEMQKQFSSGAPPPAGKTAGRVAVDRAAGVR